MNDAAPAAEQRRRLRIGGRVQGVGFRPFIYRLAKTHLLSGWVGNTADGVIAEIQGSAHAIDEFLRALPRDAPGESRINSLDVATIACSEAREFAIVDDIETATSDISADLALPLDLTVCAQCRRELFDTNNRRYRHPFIACCDCGPRWSSSAALPWNRANTALAPFSLCAECHSEYENPADRRFHAQNNCCPNCGPQISLWSRHGEILAQRAAALSDAVAALRGGTIVAVKGLGGFHLMVDARNADAIARLRERKQRPHKPLAVMFENLARLEACCEFTADERALLSSRAAPIVLLRKRDELPEIVAPGNPRLGAMLACTPLHLLLLHDAGFPLVATSGNISGEPICSDEHEAPTKLGAIADCFLVHDRPILNPIDDSVVQIAAGRPMLLRAARGYAPMDFLQRNENRQVLVALGAQQKNTVALAAHRRIRVSPHIGDLGSGASDQAVRATIEKLQGISSARIDNSVCDRHPDYRSSRLARAYSANPIRVQHHHAHVAAVMGEHDLDGEVLGIVWDGSGYGTDGTLWGGEFLRASRASFSRVATLRDFALPGGEIAAREPRRVALSLLHAIGNGDLQCFADLPLLQTFTGNELAMLQRMLDRDVNCPRSSSVGRLFDAVAALLGLQTVATFEGQAAMAVQFAAERHVGGVAPFAFSIEQSSATARIDWQPLLAALIGSMRDSVGVEAIAARFHATLAAIAGAIATLSNMRRVVLAGGCFQNRWLLELTIAELQRHGCAVFWPQSLPPNDGAIALGQIAVATALSPAS